MIASMINVRGTVAALLVATGATIPAAGELLVNGSFESGLSSWTRNTTTGSLGKQGEVSVQGYASNNGWAYSGLAARGGAKGLVMQSYRYAQTFGNSTDTYVTQSFEVGQAGEYRISLDYAGRYKNGYWEDAVNYVRLYQGTDISATPVFEGSFTAKSITAFSRFAGSVRLSETGTYTLQLVRPEPTDNIDRGVVIDNVSVEKNLIANGDFDLTPNMTGWTKSGNVACATSGIWVSSYLPYGTYALYMQTYHYPASSFGKSADASVWQEFSVSESGLHEVSFDFAGRPKLFGATAFVRIRSGSGTSGAILWEDSVVPATSVAYTHYRNYVSLDAGTYTLEFFQAAPEEEGTSTAAADSNDKAIVLDNAAIYPAGISRTAYWAGATDGDVTKAANWSDGIVPDAGTVAFFTGDFAAQIPSGATFSCREIVFAENAALTADCDWSGATGIEMTGALDLNGHRAVISGANGCAVLFSGVSGAVVAVSNVDDVVNSTLLIAGGANVALEKSGSGTYTSKIAQRYSGGTTILGGAAQPIDPPSANDDRYASSAFPAFGSGAITVQSGGTFDLRGEYGYGGALVLDGGTLTSSGYHMSSSSKSPSGEPLFATPLSKSYVSIPNNKMLLGGNGGYTDLDGKTLEITIAGQLILCSSVVTNGIFDIVSGGYICTASGVPVDASTVDFKANCAFYLDADLSVRDYEAKYASNYNEGSGALKVYGTFTPPSSHAYFRGCTMQDGSAIDLSGLSSPLGVTSSFTKGANTLGFADDATVCISLGSRRLDNERIIAWDAGTRPSNIASVTFVGGDADRPARFHVREDGLYANNRNGLIIMFR
jgi:hypothetical protein